MTLSVWYGGLRTVHSVCGGTVWPALGSNAVLVALLVALLVAGYGPHACSPVPAMGHNTDIGGRGCFGKPADAVQSPSCHSLCGIPRKWHPHAALEVSLAASRVLNI